MINVDDVITGALVNVLALAGRRLTLELRREDTGLDLARWFETYRLPPPPSVPADVADQLTGEEFQAALHELLAVRLSDGAETYARAARAAMARAVPAAEPVVNYYDDQIAALVARLEAKDPPLHAQIRAEALATRMINIMHAIERRVAALNGAPDPAAAARFLASYRRHVRDQHGMLEPPDFQRRRRVPIASIYVPAKISLAEQAVVHPPVLDVWRLAAVLDRTVLLGDPGGGKTTAANVLMHQLAAGARVPFLVTLREYAPSSRSIVGHIEHTLATFYQCPPPPGLVDVLLLTGRATVIFDGLDELTDTSRRADVARRVEHFCTEYPQAPVLVTSRLIGYDQARLDERQFTCYLLGGFDEKQVAEFARKWFALAPGARQADAAAFLSESARVTDLRTNPLLLTLLCILYRGAGTLPGDRDEIYGKCADLLIRDWDDYRRIHHELRVGAKIKPLLRELAWWMFTYPDGVTAVTARELVARTAALLSDSFESADAATDAAREFVEFCRGRMWVLADAGTTASGEALYAFTHRTFLEYFAAAHLAVGCDTPEQLAERVSESLASGSWAVIAELAVQMKDRTSVDGAARVYTALLSGYERMPDDRRTQVLGALATWLRSVDPPPRIIRDLTRRTVLSDGHAELKALLENCGTHRELVADEIGATTDRAIAAGQPDPVSTVLRLAAELNGYSRFWADCAADILRRHAPAVIDRAETDLFVRAAGLRLGLIGLGQALAMRGGLGDLLVNTSSSLNLVRGKPYLDDTFYSLNVGLVDRARTITELEAVGDYLGRHPDPPWTSHPPELELPRDLDDGSVPLILEPLSPLAYAGAAALVLIVTENGDDGHPYVWGGVPLPGLAPYISRRFGSGSGPQLPDLPVPAALVQVFRDWASGAVDVICRPDSPARILKP